MTKQDPRLAAMGSTIYKVLAGKGFAVAMYDEKGNQTEKPSEARMLWSDDMKMMVVMSQQTLGKSPRPLVSFYTSDVTPRDKFQDVYETLKNSNLYDFSFDVKPYNRTLEKRHFKSFKESWNWTGTTRSSYLPIDQVRVVIRHNRPWSPETLDRAQRWRRIRNIFLHTPDGQRFLFPYAHVSGARAMAQHLSHGAEMTDDEGRLIVNLVKLLTQLTPIQRQCRARGAVDLQNSVLETRKKIKNLLDGISRADSYRTTLDEARSWSWDWKNAPVRSKTQPTINSNPEQRTLDEWFGQFGVAKLMEDDEISPQRREEIETALNTSGGDKYDALEYLKRNVPGWESRFESDPMTVTREIETVVNQTKKRD